MSAENTCPYCHNSIASESIKCPYCGKALKYDVSENILNVQIEVYSKAIERNPQNPDLYLKRARALHSLNNNDMALKDAQKALALYQDVYNTAGISRAVIVIENITGEKYFHKNKKSE